jgi:hypothetical protein
VDGSAFYEVNLEGAFTGTNQTEIKAGIQNRINQALPPTLKDAVKPEFKGLFLRLNAKKSVIVQPGSSNDLTNELMLGTDQGGIERSRYAALRPAASGIFLKFGNLNDLASLVQDAFDTITIDGNEIKLGKKLQTSAKEWFNAAPQGGKKNYDGVREKLAILARAINDAGIGWNAKVAGSRLLLQKRSGPSFAIGSIATGKTKNIESYFGKNTRYYSLGTAKGGFQGNPKAGAEGDSPDGASYRGKESEHTGFFALDLVDMFNLMIIPKDKQLSEEDYWSLWGPASAYCTARRAFLLIDPPDDWSAYQEVVDQSKGIRKLRTGVVKDHSAVFYPRIKVRENGLLRPVGPAGAIAGLMARIDASRGVWKAPAGTEAALIGIAALDVLLTDLENGVLNREGVNCLRSFPGGIVNWGARTMDGADDFASEWKYISVRRLALYIEESLYRGTKWVVFEPNDESLWAQIRLNIGAFMHNLFRQGAFQGTTPRQAYFVKCDKETTNQTDINQGIVNILVGFAPLKPAEFVIIKISQMAGQIQT